MLKRSYIIIIIAACFATIPCFAHFTNDIVSHYMQSYLNDVYKETVALWKPQYESHISIFNQNRNKEIEDQLAQELSRLNTIPNSLRDMQTELNKNIDVYNTLVIQLRGEREKQVQNQDQLNKTIQTINQNNEVKKQIALAVRQINQEAEIINQKGLELAGLEEAENQSKIFYQNKRYLANDAIIQFKDDLRVWRADADENWNTKLTEYNNQVQTFQKWVKEQTDNIEEQKENIRSQQEQLKLLVEEINEAVAQYNQDIQIECETQECEDDLLHRKDQITEQKAERADKEIAIKDLRAKVDTQTISYNTEHTRRFNILEELRKEMEQLSESISVQQREKEQQLQEIIRFHAMGAQRKWEQAQEKLNEFKESLNRDYGGDFQQFVSHFSEWVDTNKLAFTHPEASSDDQQDTENVDTPDLSFCEEENISDPPVKAKTICDLISRSYNLLSEIQYVDSSTLAERRQKFAQKEQEIAALTRRIDALKVENDTQESQLDNAFKQYGDQVSEREQQYENLRQQLRGEWDMQVQQIDRAYELKAALLEKEYQLLNYFLFVPGSQKTEVVIHQKWDDFQGALTEFKDNIPEGIPGFSPAFMQANEIVATVLKKADEDTFSYSLIPLSVPVTSTQRNNNGKVEDEEKRQIIFSWMKTSFISHFLNVMMNRVSRVFTDYNEIDGSTDEDSKQVFIETMFLNSIYRSISFDKAIRKDKILYRAKFNSNILWILSDGKLAFPKGFYQ